MFKKHFLTAQQMRVSIFFFAMCFATMMYAADSVVTRGAKIAVTCEACHGRNAPISTPATPWLAGQHAEYGVAALMEYQHGTRDDKVMQAITASMSASDMLAVSRYYAQVRTPAVLNNPARTIGTEQRPMAASYCVNCHGINGVSATHDFPILAGQKEDYLRQVLHDYNESARRHRIMSGQAATLSDTQVEEVAHYFSVMPGLCAMPVKKVADKVDGTRICER